MKVKKIPKDKIILFGLDDIDLVKESDTKYYIDTSDPEQIDNIQEYINKLNFRSQCFYPYRKWFPLPTGYKEMWGLSYIYSRADSAHIRINHWSNDYYQKKLEDGELKKVHFSIYVSQYLHRGNTWSHSTENIKLSFN
ncbi:MAG: hypothetical protein ABFQ62_02330 [Patescibacteria group bacterium]